MLKVVLLAVVPTVVEESSRGERAMDLYSGLLRKRIIVLSDPIAPETASLTVAQLLHLEAEDPEKDIQLYINSPGGSVTDMFAVLDTMTYVSPDVQTVCVGQAASAAAVLLAAGTPGKRVLLPHARVLLHQPRGGAQGQSSDIAIVADEILRLNDTINERLAEYTGQTVERIAEDLDRDFILTADDAVEYGIADMVVATRHGQQDNLKAA